MARARSLARRACGTASEPPAAHEPPTLPPEPDRITFEPESVVIAARGRLEITGRWYGVRGRRFMRPALTMTRASDGSEVRALAELEHKPWDPSDGQVWTAAFDADVDLQDVASAELTVAPDISVPVPAPGAPSGQPGAPAAPASGTGRRAAATGAAATQRLRERVAAAAEALERERQRRAASEESLEAERAENRRLRIQLGQLQAELDLTRTSQEEAPNTAELEGVRRELLEARTRLEQVTRDRDRLAQAQAQTERELHEQMGALESARDALEAALARERTAAEAAAARATAAGAAGMAGSGDGERPRAAATVNRPLAGAAGERTRAAGAAGERTRAAGAGERSRSVGAADRRTRQEPPQASPRPAAAARRPDHLAPDRTPWTTWLTRAVALAFLAAVIVAIILVISHTVS